MKFPYGASYSPLIYPESTWEEDLRYMQQAHINLVRVGDVHGSWDRIEPQRGHFRFDLLERFYQAAAAFDVHILLSNGTACPPLWLAQRYPDVRLLSSRGERYPLAASYHWACIHHPGFLAEARRYTAALAEFAARQPNHFGWQISNEIGFPFMPTRERDELDLYCYCDHCKTRFRGWVQEKYEDLEALTHAWTWSTTAFWYNDWEAVDPPEALPHAWSGVTRWLDWRLFWQEAFADFAAWQHELIHEHDPHHPTSVNTFNFKGYDRFGTFTGLDQWELAKRVDHIGYDLYPGSGNKLRSRPEHNSIFLDHGRSVSRAAGSDFWLHEIESGPIGGWVLGPDYNTGPADILRNGWEALGHDAKLMIYMPWREWDYQPLHWGALLDLERQPTERYTAAAELGAFIHAHGDFLQEAHVPRGEVALLESKPNAIFFRGVDQEELLFQAQRGAYRAFWELGYRVDFLIPELVLAGAAEGYRAVALPLVGLLDLSTAEVLRAYVERGGLLVGFARCATLDARGWYHHRLPIPPLREVFGLESVTPDSESGGAISYGTTPYSGHMKRDLLSPAPDTEVLGRFEDGRPAVTLHALGDGYGLYFATQAGVGYAAGEGTLLRTVLKDLYDRLGVAPELYLDYPEKEVREIDPHLLRLGTREMVILAGSLPTDTTVSLRIQASKPHPESVSRLWPTKMDLTRQVVDGYLHIEVPLEAHKGGVIEVNW